MILSEFSLKRPVTMIMIFVAVTVLGIIALMNLKLDLLPNFDIPIVAVMSEYSGAGPTEVEGTVSRTLEGAVSQVQDIKNVFSISREGMSLVLGEFNWGTDVDARAIDTREKLDMVKRYLPDDVTSPMVFKFDPSMMPVIIMGVTSEQRELRELREFAEDKIKDQLSQVEGVAMVTVTGGREREIHVEVNRSRLEGVGLSLDQVMMALRLANMNMPGGHLKTGVLDFLIRTPGEFKTVGEIGQTVVGNKGGVQVFLRDVANVSDSYSDLDSEVKMNGRPSVVLQIQKQSSANTVQVSNRVLKKVAELQKNMPADVKLVISMDTADTIRKSISNVVQEAVVGALLAVIVIIFFLYSFSSTMIIGLAIPFSLVATFILMYFNNMTLNIITLGGLSLGIGRLVDDSIVVLENIFRHREDGMEANQAALTGSNEVAMAVLATTITTIVVFLPIGFVQGMAGIMFKPMALTVGFALVASYFISMMLVPLLTTKFMKVEHDRLKRRDWFHRSLAWFDRLIRGITDRYQMIVQWAIHHKKKVVIAILAFGLVSLSLLWPFKFIGSEFIPNSDSGEIQIAVKMPVGTSFQKTGQVMNYIDSLIHSDVPEALSVYAYYGDQEGLAAIRGTGPHKGNVRIRLASRSQRNRSDARISDDLRSKLKEIPDAELVFSGGDMSAMGGGSIAGRFTGSTGDLQVEIAGYDFVTAERLAKQVSELMAATPGTKNVNVSLQAGYPELQVMVDREKAGSLGFSVYQIASTVEAAFKGKTATRFRDAVRGKEYNVVVRLAKQDRQDKASLDGLTMASPMGQNVALSNVARVQKAFGPIDIIRKNQNRIVTVSCYVAGRPLNAVTNDLTAKIKGLTVPAGFTLTIGGSAKDMKESFTSLLFAALLALLLVYMILAAQFESLLDPFIVMFSVPLGIMGVIWALFLAGMNLSVTAFLGIIMMIGIVVSNAILLVDCTNQLRQGGMELHQAVVTAGRTRFRPILMTSVVTILAMIPMALGMGESGEMMAPMATSVIGGLAVSMVLTLIFVPTLYVIFEERLRK